MEQEIEKNNITVPLIVFNVALVGLIVSLGFLIYKVDTKKTRAAEQKAISSPVVFFVPPVQAQSFVVFDLKTGTLLAEKESQVARPLASITKVMSALVARKMLPKENEVMVRKEFLVEEGDSGLRDGEVFKLSDLLDLSLIVSSNDGARSIASVAGAFKLGTKDYTLGRAEFIKQMNAEAQALGLNTLFFTNETGLDNPTGTTGGYGSAQEVAKLFAYILKEYPDLLEATQIQKEAIRSNVYVHEAVNTNDSLSQIPNVIASKTGFTNMAGGNLAVVFDAGFNRPIAIVVLGSTTNGRFADVVALASSTLHYLAR